MLTDLVAYILADPGVSALTQNLAPDVLPEQSPLPAIVYQQIEAAREHYQPDGAFTGFNHPVIQFKCFAGSYADAVATCDALLAALEGKVPLALGSPVTTWIYGMLPESPRDDEEAYGVGRLYVRMVDVVVLHA